MKLKTPAVNNDNCLYNSYSRLKKAYKNPGKRVKPNSMALRDYFSSKSLNMSNIGVNSIVAFNSNVKINKKPEYYDISHPSSVASFILNQNKKLNDNILKKAVYLIDDCAVELSVIK